MCSRVGGYAGDDVSVHDLGRTFAKLAHKGGAVVRRDAKQSGTYTCLSKLGSRLADAEWFGVGTRKSSPVTTDLCHWRARRSPVHNLGSKAKGGREWLQEGEGRLRRAAGDV